MSLVLPSPVLEGDNTDQSRVEPRIEADFETCCRLLQMPFVKTVKNDAYFSR